MVLGSILYRMAAGEPNSTVIGASNFGTFDPF